MPCRTLRPQPDRQAEIDKNIKKLANKSEQKVYARIGRNYSDIIKEYGEIPAPIKYAALIVTADMLLGRDPKDNYALKMILKPYKKKE